MSKSFLQLRTEINASIFPDGAPENLADPLRDGDGNPIAPAPLTMLYIEALAEIAKWVPCERATNVNVIKFCNTFWNCGMTVVEVPHGVVNRVYTIASEDGVFNWCDAVFYRQAEWPQPECEARQLLWDIQIPANTGMRVLPMGFKQAESSTDFDINDTQVGRARGGVWAIHDRRLWLTPWLQSNEKLVLEWTGIKKTWNDDDLVNDDQDYRKAVKLYVQYGYERDYGDPALADIHRRLPDGRLAGTFDEALADLIWECRERTKVQPQKLCDNTVPEMSYFLPALNASCGCVRHGSGAPSAATGSNGDIYVNDDDATIYSKVGGTWTVVSGSGSGGGGSTGVVDPEGVVTGSPGNLYFNTVNTTFWVKTSGTATTTGWTQLI